MHDITNWINEYIPEAWINWCDPFLFLFYYWSEIKRYNHSIVQKHNFIINRNAIIFNAQTFLMIYLIYLFVCIEKNCFLYLSKNAQLSKETNLSCLHNFVTFWSEFFGDLSVPKPCQGFWGRIFPSFSGDRLPSWPYSTSQKLY